MTDSRPDSGAAGTTGRRTGKELTRIVFLALLLIAAWVLWSGFFKPLLLALGALSCALTVYIVARMGFFRDESFVFGYGVRLLGFWAWLAREVVKSSMEVARVVLGRKIDPNPQVVEVDASDLGLVDQALLGNSITLTPGTLTIDIDEGRLMVHALTPEGAAALENGEMQRRVAALRER